jgi:DNA-directed RNA polymerase specialized sigma24 family protein
VQIDYLRRIEGRIRCGNCAHHRLAADQSRKCTHPDPAHPWTGREVEAGVDPRVMDPSCKRYVSKRETVAQVLAGQDAIASLVSPSELPDADLGKRERAAIILDCLGAVQLLDPKAHLVVLLAYFRNRTNQEIAGVLKTTVRTVTRYKEKGLSMLREELENRGIAGTMEFE